MDPRVRTAIIEQLHLFKDHPLNVKHRIVVQKLNFGLCVHEWDPTDLWFVGTDRHLYVWCAVLLQRLKDALKAEGFEQRYSAENTWWSKDIQQEGERPRHCSFFLLNADPSPEVLLLLQAINQSKLWE